MEHNFGMYLTGVEAVKAAQAFTDGHCYRSLYADGVKLAQVEIVLDDMVEVAYIASLENVEKAINALAENGFSGVPYEVYTETVDGCYAQQNSTGRKGIIGETAATATEEPAKTESKEEEKEMDNTTNEAKKELLSINPHALQGLHSMIGYDFQQPHAIAHIKGRFTTNSALKAIGGASRENVVALLAMDHGRSYLDRLNLVTVDSAGRIDIDHKGGYKFGIDSVCMKGMFEDIRKSDRAECFIICQRSEYVKKPQEKPFDTSARYEYVEGKDRKTGDGNGKSWIANITVRTLDGSNRKIELTKDGHKETYSRIIYRRPDEARPQTHFEIIDKSGYLLPERRADLQRRADQLRRDRAKAAYQATDNAAKVEELRAMVEAKKAEFAAVIASATDSEALRTAAHELYFKFMWTMSEFERFADKTARRDYMSIEAAENAYTAIKSKLEKEAANMTTKDIKTPGELYDAMMDATTPAERDHHASDLYIKVTPATMRIIDRYEFSSQVSSFRDQTDPRRALWYDIPFAYLPYWQGQRD